jgi:hypothetical protein
MKQTDNRMILKYFLNHVGEWINGADLSKALKPGAISWAYRSRISNIKIMLETNPESLFKMEHRPGSNGLYDYRMAHVHYIEPSVNWDQAGQGALI